MVDCLSDLAADWYLDTMLGNFFLLVRPYVYDLGSLAYFAILRDRHSFRATTPINETAQIVLDIYHHQSHYYVRPLKVLPCHSSTMHMFHRGEGYAVRPVTESAGVSEILNASPCLQLESNRYRMGVWQSAFVHAEERLRAYREGQGSAEELDAIFQKLLRMAISRDEAIRIVEPSLFGPDVEICLHADTLHQTALCYLLRKKRD